MPAGCKEAPWKSESTGPQALVKSSRRQTEVRRHTAGAIVSSSWPLGVLTQKNSTKITTSYGLHSPNTWHELGFTIKRAQFRTCVAKMGGCCMSSTSEMSKYRRTWPLAMLRHIPIALGASGALGVGWDAPRSVKVGHTPTGTMLWPPRRHFMRKCMVTWGKFRLPSTGSLKKQNTHGQGEGRDGFGMGGGHFCSIFCPRETHTRRLVDISTHVSRRCNFRETRG
jgi:hypothetical protein